MFAQENVLRLIEHENYFSSSIVHTCFIGKYVGTLIWCICAPSCLIALNTLTKKERRKISSALQSVCPACCSYSIHKIMKFSTNFDVSTICLQIVCQRSSKLSVVPYNNYYANDQNAVLAIISYKISQFCKSKETFFSDLW